MKTNEINEILMKYSRGEADLAETNAALEEAGSPIRLAEGRNQLTEEEIAATVTGGTPEEASGWGLLDTGTGTLDKVRVTAGRLDYPVNQVRPDGGANMAAFVLMGGQRYQVLGDRLAEPSGDAAARTPERLPAAPDLRRRQDLAGQTAVQHTLAGDFQVFYDALGYAARAELLGREDRPEDAEEPEGGAE